MNEEFSYENIGKFIGAVFKEQGEILYLEEAIKKLHNTEKWDGKDYSYGDQIVNNYYLYYFFLFF